jgi:hypothetical protein
VSPSRREVQAGSDIEIGANTRFFNRDQDHYYNQRESHLSNEEKDVYESPLKKFNNSHHSLYSDRYIEGQQFKLGTQQVEDPYSRSRQIEKMRREPDQRASRIGSRKFNSTSKKIDYVSRSPAR